MKKDQSVIKDEIKNKDKNGWSKWRRWIKRINMQNENTKNMDLIKEINE